MVALAPAPPVTVKQLVEVPPTDDPLEGVGGKDSPITEKLPLLSSMRLLKMIIQGVVNMKTHVVASEFPRGNVFVHVVAAITIMVVVE